jgi:hypothetical protein
MVFDLESLDDNAAERVSSPRPAPPYPTLCYCGLCIYLVDEVKHCDGCDLPIRQCDYKE